MTFLESLEEAIFVVSGVLLPTAENNADPFKGQGAHGYMVRFTPSQELLIIGLGPEGVWDGMSGVFVEGLTEELGTTPAPTDSLALAAAIQHRSDTTLYLQLVGRAQGGAISSVDLRSFTILNQPVVQSSDPRYDANPLCMTARWVPLLRVYKSTIFERRQ